MVSPLPTEAERVDELPACMVEGKAAMPVGGEGLAITVTDILAQVGEIQLVVVFRVIA